MTSPRRARSERSTCALEKFAGLRPELHGRTRDEKLVELLREAVHFCDLNLMIFEELLEEAERRFLADVDPEPKP